MSKVTILFFTGITPQTSHSEAFTVSLEGDLPFVFSPGASARGELDCKRAFWKQIGLSRRNAPE